MALAELGPIYILDDEQVSALLRGERVAKEYAGGVGLRTGHVVKIVSRGHDYLTHPGKYYDLLANVVDITFRTNRKKKRPHYKTIVVFEMA